MFLYQHERPPCVKGAPDCRKTIFPAVETVGANIVRPQQLAVTLDSTGAYGMLPYGVGADSISARAIWGNAKPHGRALLAPTMHFFDSLKGSPQGEPLSVSNHFHSHHSGGFLNRCPGNAYLPCCPSPVYLFKVSLLTFFSKKVSFKESK